MTPSQIRSAVQKAQRDAQRAVDNYNRAARQYNSAVTKFVNDYNREIRNYNAKARAHNQRVESQRRRLNQELRRLQSRPATTTFTVVRRSTTTFVDAYSRAEAHLSGQAGPTQEFLDLTSDEAANSVYLLFVLYLVWAEFVMIGQICSWCTVVHVITAVLFVFYLTTFVAGAPEPA